VTVLALSGTAQVRADGQERTPAAVVVALEQGVTGTAVWRSPPDKEWQDLQVFQPLCEGEEVAATGTARIALYYFSSEKETVWFDKEKAPLSLPLVVQASTTQNGLLSRFCTFFREFSDTFLKEPEKLKMRPLGTRSAKCNAGDHGNSGIHLVSPRNTKVFCDRPSFELSSSGAAPLQISLEHREKVLWTRQCSETSGTIVFPENQPSLKNGNSYEVVLTAAGKEVDRTVLIFKPLSEEKDRDSKEWQNCIPGNGVPNTVLQVAYAMEAGYQDTARRLLLKGLKEYPKDRTLTSLLERIETIQGFPAGEGLGD